MQKLKIDVTKIDKSLLFKGSKGTYLDVTLMTNRDGVDQYGNDGFIIQDVSKEAREAGIKGPILGNWKHIGQRQANQNGAPPPPKPAPGDHSDHDDGDDIPF